MNTLRHSAIFFKKCREARPAGATAHGVAEHHFEQFLWVTTDAATEYQMLVHVFLKRDAHAFRGRHGADGFHRPAATTTAALLSGQSIYFSWWPCVVQPSCRVLSLNLRLVTRHFPRCVPPLVRHRATTVYYHAPRSCNIWRGSGATRRDLDRAGCLSAGEEHRGGDARRTWHNRRLDA